MKCIHQFSKRIRKQIRMRDLAVKLRAKRKLKKTKNKEDQLFSLPFNSKTHSTLKKNFYSALCRRSLFFNNSSRLESYKRDFQKLLNNSNFGNDCRNNIGNCSLELMFDGFEEIAYIKKYLNIFTDLKFREFFSADILRVHVECEYQKNKNSTTKTMNFMKFLWKIQS